MQESLNKLNSLVLIVPYLDLRHNDASLAVKSHDIGPRPPLYLLRLEGDQQLVLGVWDELEAGEAVGGEQLTHVGRHHAREVLGSHQHEVGALMLVGYLVVAVRAGAAR